MPVGVSFSLTDLEAGISPAPPGQSLGTDGGGDVRTLGNGEDCFRAAAAPCLLRGSTGISSASCEGNEIEEDFSGPCPLIVSKGGNSPLANDYRQFTVQAL